MLHLKVSIRLKNVNLIIDTVKLRKQNKNLQTDLVKKTPKDKNQKHTDLLQCSYDMVLKSN